MIARLLDNAMNWRLTTRAALVRLAGLFLLALVTLACQSTEPTEAPEAVQRLSDVAYHDPAHPDRGSASYSRVEFLGDTREVCPEATRKMPLSGEHLFQDVDLVAGSRIELAFGVVAEATFSASVEYVAAVTDDKGRRVEVRGLVDGTEGHELGRWHSITLDTGDMTGRARVSLSSASSTSGIDPDSGRTLARAYFACPIVLGPTTAPDGYDVLLISLDTLRADRLGAYGYDRATSPNLDRLFGESGVVVERAYAQATNTLRGHAAMLTGLRPAVAVTVQDDTSDRVRGFATLGDRLRTAGYLTAAFTENAYVSNFFGFATGFDLFREDKDFGAMAYGQMEAKRTFARALEWWRAHSAQRKFAFVHTYQVHEPYTPPPLHAEKFPPPANASPIQVKSSQYDAEVAYLDAELARFLDELAKLGSLDRTILIITADHGEEFGEHGGQQHGAHMHDEVVRVPLMLRAPGLLPTGVRRSGPGAVVDIVPTVLDLLALPVPDYLDGISLLPHLREGEGIAPRLIPSEAFTPSTLLLTGEDPSWISPSIALTRFPYRVIRIRTPSGARHTVYDLAADPGELRNLNDERTALPPEVDAMIEEADTYLERSSQRANEVLTRLGIPLESGSATPVDQSVFEKLRALGYVD
jgi:arylsulfatase A-like enzyme